MELELKLEIWKKQKLTVKQVEEILRQGHEIYTEATAMVNGGSHCWWIGEDKDIHCYGQGPDWRDQNDQVILTIEEACERIAKISQNEEIMIRIHEPFDFE